ncbi:MAG TPA: transporter [Halobacteriales archaeon]|nr:transporter [Halobacteriales archaeon]
MAIERETLIDVVVSLLAVGGFIVAVLLVGLSYGDGGLSGQGALALVALIVGFIVVMTAAGYWLSGREA